jgi:hypothetical protein
VCIDFLNERFYKETMFIGKREERKGERGRGERRENTHACKP